ncbi:FKBP-type peptidyl-prolyl cis-trans isomerase [Verrucomicrobium sp. BvORR034]|jgi:FKBP-type peptidyl-prolyl cis-trans isomerase|uniref:FKBP-type peptidyl-prolyl cis-trans isomerase n=1 Tax=Verrucomicrobium sp. BvORR034 TaxID=1396418 RepID=UPI0006793959|nr:FKBP-type peptidyl-prolyl cis-trans isomerase [Verrucomicrobium sp. BvORR034]
MKVSLLLPLIALSLAAPLRAQETKSTEAKPAETAAAPAPVIDAALLEKVSYFYGTQMGGQFQEMGVQINVDSLAAGVKDAIDKKEPKYSREELMATMGQFEQAMNAKIQKEMGEAASKNSQEGEKFLAENGKRPGVTTTASGLQYEVIKKAEGAKPKAEDVVTVHYVGTLINGTEFDSSVKRGEPANFPLNQVIAGWTEGLQLMTVGSKYKLFVPSKLAYGEQGSPRAIGPNSTLIFEVELLKIGAEQ